MDYLPKFDDFWMLYPRREAKKSAEKAWLKLTLGNKRLAMLALPKHVRRWAETCPDMTTVPHPATWLNGSRWLDEIANVKVYAPPAPRPVSTAPQVESPKSDAVLALAAIRNMKGILAGGRR